MTVESQQREPYFSVIVPLYNKERYVERCVGSILFQTYTDYEVIVVDDGSTDNSANLISGFADERLRLLKQTNQGVGAARNRGMQESRGKWIAFLDADDSWSPLHLQELYVIAQDFPSAGLVSSGAIEVTEGKGPRDAKESKSRSKIKEVDYFEVAAKSIGFINSSSSAVSREAYEQLGGFREDKLGEDLEYWARIALSYPVAISTRTTSFYYRDTGGVMGDSVQNKNESLPQISALSQISPSVALLCSRGKTAPDLFGRQAIRLYLNSRIYSAVKGALYVENVPRARSCARFFIPPLRLREQTVRAALRLPRSVLLSAIRSFKSQRSVRAH